MQRTILSIFDNTSYIAGTMIGRASDWYDDIVKVPSLWNAVPITNQYKSFFVWYESRYTYSGFGKACR